MLRLNSTGLPSITLADMAALRYYKMGKKYVVALRPWVAGGATGRRSEGNWSRLHETITPKIRQTDGWRPWPRQTRVTICLVQLYKEHKGQEKYIQACQKRKKNAGDPTSWLSKSGLVFFHREKNSFYLTACRRGVPWGVWQSSLLAAPPPGPRHKIPEGKYCREGKKPEGYYLDVRLGDCRGPV